MKIELETDSRGLVVRTPYSTQFVTELKRLVPASDRLFDGPSKAWIVDPRHGQTIQKLILTIWHEAVGLPAVTKSGTVIQKETVRLEYLGQCKARADGSVSASGHDGQTWAYVVPEGVLKSFFNSDVEISLDGVENAPRAKPATLYGVLLVSPKAGFEEIKSAYKRMARLTHPDVNHEPDADEQFKTIKRAWDVLGDAVMRCRYDAGLALEASLAKTQRRQTGQKFYDLLAANYGHQNFRSPLRCGLLTIDGERRLGRIHVSRIHAWDDITDAQGRVMVSSWNMDTQTYEVRWA